MNKKEPLVLFDSSDYMTGLRYIFSTLYVKSENVIIQDKSLGFEINLTERIKEIDKLVIDGITFVKEK